MPIIAVLFKRENMDFLKKNYKVIVAIFGFLFALYVLPNFIDLSTQKSYLEKKMEENFGFKVSINGKISFSILPKPSLILNRVQIYSKDENSKAGMFINASKIFVSTDISNFFNKNFSVNKIGVVDATFYASAYKISGYENLDDLLNGKIFKQISLRNSRVLIGDKFINGINVTLNTTKDGKIKGTGNFAFKDGSVENLSILLSYLNSENYNVISDFVYTVGRSRIKNNLTFIVNGTDKKFSGTTDVFTDNITKLVQFFNPDMKMPSTPAFKEKIDIKASFQNSNDAILVNNGSIEGSNVVASFKGKIPFMKNGHFEIDKDNISMNIDFSNLVLDRLFIVKRDIAQNPISSLSDARNLLELFKYANMNITAKSIILNNAVMNNFKLSTSAIFNEDKFNGLDISDLSYQIAKNTFSLNGKLLNIQNDMTLDAKVETNIPFIVTNIFNTRLKITNFVSDVRTSPTSFNLNNMKLFMGQSNLFGSFSYNQNEGINNYSANLKSDFIDLDNIFKENINLSFIILKLSELQKNRLNLVSAFKRFKMNNDNYKALKLNTEFFDGNLHIKNLTFEDNDYSSQMKGDLIDIVGENGKFKDFEYKISSSTLKGLTLPFIRNTFVEKMIANGVNQINII